MRNTWLISNSSPITMRLGENIGSCVPRSSGSTRRALPNCFAPFYTASWGRRAWDPEDLLRSLVLMILAGFTSIPEWVRLMREEPFYTILSGFDPGRVPGVGTFYDFMNRVVGPPPPAGRRRPRRLTPAHKRELKGAKRRPSPRHEAIVARLVESLLKDGRHWGPPAAEQVVNLLLKALCVEPAVEQKLLSETVVVSGDGTKVGTYANSYGHKECECANLQCGCPRRFTDAEASTGYDAYHNRFVYGHTLYALTACSPGSKVELPVYLMRATGCRSDAVLGPLALSRAQGLLPLRMEYAAFDGAHDAGAFYELGQHYEIPLIIPLAGAPPRYPEDGIERDADGTPKCQAGRRMYPDGYQSARRRNRWRCPLVKGPEQGDRATCPHLQDCSTAKAGRIVYTYPGKDARLNCVPARGTMAWKKQYDRRTASERGYARRKVHLGLARTRTRGGSRWAFRDLITAIAHHLVTWSQHQPST